VDIQRLRNLTTGILHTKMDDIYLDIEYFTGAHGVMTHMLPSACRALEPYLRAKVADVRFWNVRHDPSHVGDIEIPPMDEAALRDFWGRFQEILPGMRPL